jgi:hypothetical protein
VLFYAPKSDFLKKSVAIIATVKKYPLRKPPFHPESKLRDKINDNAINALFLES